MRKRDEAVVLASFALLGALRVKPVAGPLIDPLPPEEPFLQRVKKKKRPVNYPPAVLTEVYLTQ
jgi:hypothetical protein